MNEEEKKIIIDFVNSDNFMLLNDYCTKPYETTINDLQDRIDKAIEYINYSLNNPLCDERKALKYTLNILEGEENDNTNI